MTTEIVLDDRLIEQGLTLTGAHDRQALLELALRELIRARQERKDLLDLAGHIRFRDDFDHKRARELRDGAD